MLIIGVIAVVLVNYLNLVYSTLRHGKQPSQRLQRDIGDRERIICESDAGKPQGLQASLCVEIDEEEIY